MALEGQPLIHLVNQPSDQLRDLLTTLGVVTPPGSWGLSNVVLPVAIVSSGITINAATSTPVWDTRTTAGQQTNPAANTRLADTGSLDVGNYETKVAGNVYGGVAYQLRHRNAADNADIYTEYINYASDTWHEVDRVFKLAQSERIVIENVSAPGAGKINQFNIWYRKL